MDFIAKESNVAPTMGAGALDRNYEKKMCRSVVFIETNNSDIGEGTGSIVNFSDSQPMLLTCHHVIPSKEIAEKCTISFDRENRAQPGTSFSGKALFDFRKRFFTHKHLDCSLIPLKASAIPGDEERAFFALDQFRCLKSQALKKDDQMYLVHYPLMEGECVQRTSSCPVQFLESYLIGHLAETHGGSSGCPVLKEVDHKWVLVGLHTGSIKKLMEIKLKQEFNVATNVEEIHKLCTTPGEYKLPAIDKKKVMEAMQKDLPRIKALREAYDELKRAYPEHVKPGRVPFVNLVVVKPPPRLDKTKENIREYLKATTSGIDQSSNSTERIDYENILTSSENENNSTRSDTGKYLVIAGPPGTGKTTLARKLCRDLCSGLLPNLYQLVLFAELKAFRMYLKQVTKKASLLTLLEYLGLPKADNLCSMVKEDAGKNVAVILDGYDEISDDKLLSAWVSQLFSRKLYLRMRSCDVVITTRPSQLAQLIKTALSHFEIRGFLRSDIEHYIKAYFRDAVHTAKDVIHRLHSLPLVHGLCSNPRVLEIMCEVFEYPDDEPLPSNLSGMFLRYLRYQLETDLMQRDTPVETRITDLLDVPQDLFPGFYTLCSLAYKCCLNQQLLLKEKELGEVKKHVDKRRSVYNLLSAVPVRSPPPFPCVLLYQSDHKTVTEALAAVHIAKAEQQQIWEKQFAVPHMAQVWMIYCGLTGLKSVDLRRLSSLSVSERGREVIKGVVRWALDDEDMLLMVSLHEANNSDEAKLVLPAVLKTTIRATIKSSCDAMVVGYAITQHPNLQTVDLSLAIAKDMSEIDLRPLNARNVKSVKLTCCSVAHMQAVLPKNVEEVELTLDECQLEGLVEALGAYQCLHSLTLLVYPSMHHDDIFIVQSIVQSDSLFQKFNRLKVFRIFYRNNQDDTLNASVESLQNVLVLREKCSLHWDLPLLTPHQVSAVLDGLRRADKLKELHLYYAATARYAKVSPNQCLLSCDEVEELVATHPQLVKVDVGCEEPHMDMLPAVAKGAIKNENITHLGLHGEHLSSAVLPLLRSPSADHITSVRAIVNITSGLGDGEWCSTLLEGAMSRSRATCHLSLREVTTASVVALLSWVHNVPKLEDLTLKIQSAYGEDDQTLRVDESGVEAAFRVCQLKRLRIEHSLWRGHPHLYPLWGAVLRGIAANSTAQVDTCIYGEKDYFDVDKLAGQLPQQTLEERFEVVKTRNYSFIISHDAACPSVPAPTLDPVQPKLQAANRPPGNPLITPERPPDQPPLSEPPCTWQHPAWF